MFPNKTIFLGKEDSTKGKLHKVFLTISQVDCAPRLPKLALTPKSSGMPKSTKRASDAVNDVSRDALGDINSK